MLAVALERGAAQRWQHTGKWARRRKGRWRDFPIIRLAQQMFLFYLLIEEGCRRLWESWTSQHPNQPPLPPHDYKLGTWHFNTFSPLLPNHFPLPVFSPFIHLDYHDGLLGLSTSSPVSTLLLMGNVILHLCSLHALNSPSLPTERGGVKIQKW